MITLLSPAKKLNLEQGKNLIEPSQPIFASDTQNLVRVAKTQSASDLKKLMKLSDNLAELNAERFKTFRLNGRSNSTKPAAFTFDGNVYEGLDIQSLSKSDLNYAQDHLRILSGLYGSLRPMDAIQPYRLEMGTRLKTKRGSNLYQFWGARIAESLMTDMDSHKDITILNLASNEYFKAVDKNAISSPIIEAKFLNIKGRTGSKPHVLRQICTWADGAV
ncbi:MAG: YaaA family protein, partial [Robiginitomaculum sp.]|nr:YaaA family protein [Robiginitomaculum sp.]